MYIKEQKCEHHKENHDSSSHLCSEYIRQKEICFRMVYHKQCFSTANKSILIRYKSDSTALHLTQTVGSSLPHKPNQPLARQVYFYNTDTIYFPRTMIMNTTMPVLRSQNSNHYRLSKATKSLTTKRCSLVGQQTHPEPHYNIKPNEDNYHTKCGSCPSYRSNIILYIITLNVSFNS